MRAYRSVDPEAQPFDHRRPGGGFVRDQPTEILGLAADEVESGGVHFFDDDVPNTIASTERMIRVRSSARCWVRDMRSSGVATFG